MSQVGAVLAQLLAALTAAAPGRLVTDTYLDFAHRKRADLLGGVFTLLMRGGSGEDYSEKLELILVGQIQVAEDASGAALQEAELAMLDQVRCFVRGVQGATVRAKRWRQSLQMEHPFGWISVELEVGPLDLITNCGATLEPFITFRADWDMAAPDGQIDATDNVTLEQ